MPDQINQKDADQDQLIAVLTHRIEDAEKMTEELREIRRAHGTLV